MERKQIDIVDIKDWIRDASIGVHMGAIRVEMIGAIEIIFQNNELDCIHISLSTRGEKSLSLSVILQ